MRDTVSIGKGLIRIVVRSKAKRGRLARIPGVRVEGERVIFPTWLAGNIRRIMNPPARKRIPEPEQTTLF